MTSSAPTRYRLYTMTRRSFGIRLIQTLFLVGAFLFFLLNGVLLFAGLAAPLGVYVLLRPPRRDFSIEVGERQLTIRRLAATRIPYSAIAAVAPWQPRRGELLEVLEAVGAALAFVFSPVRLPTGQRWVKLTFRNWIFPPLLPPKRSWVLMLHEEDVEKLVADISMRLQEVQSRQEA